LWRLKTGGEASVYPRTAAHGSLSKRPEPWSSDSPAEEVSYRNPAIVIQAWVALSGGASTVIPNERLRSAHGGPTACER